MEHDDKRLHRWYRQFNIKWFAGDLPDEVEAFFGPCERDHNMYAFVEDFDRVVGYELCVDHKWVEDDRITKLWLLHEMAHLKLWPYVTHGERFHQEQQRLAAIGAYKGLL